METKNAPYGWLVKRIAHRLEQNMNHFLKPYNITIMQSWILLFLKKTEASYTYKELEKEFEVSQPTLNLKAACAIIVCYKREDFL